MMKSLAVLMLWVLTLPLCAQSSLKWYTDMYEACNQSRQSGKPVMACFEGSDWCGWCSKLKTTVLSQPKFAVWANQNVILLQVDYPKQKLLPNMLQYQNYELGTTTFSVQGYPTIWVFSPVSFDESKKSIRVQPMGTCGYPKQAQGREYQVFMDSLAKIVANKEGAGFEPRYYEQPFFSYWSRFLSGTWAHQKADNLYWMKVSFNHEKEQFEGILVKHGKVSQNVGFELEEICWTASPNTVAEDVIRQKPSIAVQQKWRAGNNGVSSSSFWKADVLSLANVYTNLITTNSGMSFYKQDSLEAAQALEKIRNSPRKGGGTLANGAKIPVKFTGKIGSDDNSQPQVVVAGDVADDEGRLLIADGSVVNTTFQRIHSQNNGTKGGSITVHFHTVQSVDGQQIQLSGNMTAAGKESAGSSLASMVGKTLKGKEAVIEKGTVVNEVLSTRAYRIRQVE